MFVSCSRAEDVVAIEYAWLSCCLISMFSLESGSVNSKTSKFFNYTFPNVLDLYLVSHRSFSFWKDWLSAWIPGQRKALSPRTRFNLLGSQIDHTFEGMDGGIGSHDICNFPQAMTVGFNWLFSQLSVSTDRMPSMIHWCLQAVVAAGTFPRLAFL